jgi:tetratricopeptide (TPR) repeat protein
MRIERKTFILIAVLACISLIIFQKDVRFSIAKIFFENGEKYFSKTYYNVDKAEKFYKVAIFVDSDYPVAHYQLGRIYFLNGEFNQAISEFNKEMGGNPDLKQVYYMSGLTYGYEKNYDLAISNFETYIEFRPSEWAPYNDLAWVYLLKDDYQNANDIATQGLKVDPQNPWLLSNLGKAEIGLENYSDAKENLILAQEYSQNLTADNWNKVYPGNDPKIAQSGINEMKAIIFLNLAVADKKLNQKEEAEMYYQKYLDLLPQNDPRRIPTEDFMLMP